MDHIVNSLEELESFNPSSVQDFMLSLSASEQPYSDPPHRPQIASPFTPSNPNNFGFLDHHAGVPIMSFDYSEGSYFPPGGNSVPFYELERSGSRFQTEKANGSSYGNCGEKKRRRANDREAQKPKDVVHVRAKRGQATDSHSLAERLRREKINEKLRCLQDLVPGCYKTMGMAVMLDVIINYVRSLQNQIDFLSMKLSAASLYYDFNSSDDALGNMQVMQGYEAQGMDSVLLGEAYGALPQAHAASWTL